MVVSSSTFISDSVIFIRDLLRTKVTDPISATRGSNSKFVVTAFPERETKYPLITIKLTNFTGNTLGMKTNAQILNVNYEARVWARNIKERDELTQAVYDALRTNQFTTLGTINNELVDFAVTSAVDVDEEKIHSKVIGFRYMFITQ